MTERVRQPALTWLATVLAEPWAIRLDNAEELLAVLRREGEGVEAVAARLGRPLDNTRAVIMRDAVAVVPMVGPIARRASLFSDVSGGLTAADVATDLAQALADPKVQAVLLDFDSPGGQFNGTGELAAMIRAPIGGRTKPVWSYVGGLCCSAAYWLAAGSDRIIVNPTATLGSIGVIMSIRDDAPIERPGQPKTYQFVSSQSPNKRPALETEAGRGQVQALVDRYAAEFVGAVAAFRGVSTEAVLARFGAGGELVGADAVKAGMADGLGSLESVIAELAAFARQPARGRGMVPPAARSAGVPMSDNQGAAVPEITASSLIASHPALVEQFRAEGRAEGRDAGQVAGHAAGLEAGLAEGRSLGAAAERARILAVEQLALPGHEALIAQLKADGTTTAEQAAIQVLQAERAKGATALDKLQAQAGQVPAVPFTAPAETAPQLTGAERATRIRELVDAEAAAGRKISYAEASARLTGK